MKQITYLITFLLLSSCAELQQVVGQLPQTKEINADMMATGLREALNFGIERQVQKLTQKDGFFRNEFVKILLPEELKKVDKAFRDIGLKDEQIRD